MLQIYESAFNEAFEAFVSELDLKQDGLTESINRFLRVFGIDFTKKTAKKIDRVITAIDVNANKNANQVPKLLAPKYLKGGQKAIAAFRKSNVELISSVPKVYAERARKVLAKNPDLHPSALKKELLNAAQGSKARAQLWATDQTLKLNADITREKHEAVGITSYVWRTSGDIRVREMHDLLKDKVYDYKKPPITNVQGDRNNPGRDYRCRCTAEPILPAI